MENTEKKKHKITPKDNFSLPCDSCMYYDEIDDDGTLGCVVNLDEDDLYRQREDKHSGCPYYRFYNEYKSVQRQN